MTTSATTIINAATVAQRAQFSTEPLPHAERAPSRAGSKGAKVRLDSSTSQAADVLTGLKLGQSELLYATKNATPHILLPMPGHSKGRKKRTDAKVPTLTYCHAFL